MRVVPIRADIVRLLFRLLLPQELGDCTQVCTRYGSCRTDACSVVRLTLIHAGRHGVVAMQVVCSPPHRIRPLQVSWVCPTTTLPTHMQSSQHCVACANARPRMRVHEQWEQTRAYAYALLRVCFQLA